MPFRAATYNVLATAYIKPEWFAAVPPELLRPEGRLPALVRHVEALDADLLCLQEVEDETFAALQRLKAAGYDGHFEKKGRGRPDGCATFFRREIFALRGLKRLDYRDAGHIALILSLEHEGRLLGVANTHLRWDPPGAPLDEQLGHRQAAELLAERARFQPPQNGWLLCGDFNRAPDSEVVAAVRQAGHEHAHAGRPQARSCVANGRAALIDYLFHSPQLRARPLDPPAVGDETPLPSPEQPSDHLALAADFEWA
jgi:mRNA deadenylase 3'-5' endonuclease subunit Ccr4